MYLSLCVLATLFFAFGVVLVWMGFERARRRERLRVLQDACESSLETLYHVGVYASAKDNGTTIEFAIMGGGHHRRYSEGQTPIHDEIPDEPDDIDPVGYTAETEEIEEDQDADEMEANISELDHATSELVSEESGSDQDDMNNTRSSISDTEESSDSSQDDVESVIVTGDDQQQP
jgi:hypothetical protein